jgi:hypothetical protein
MRRLAFAAAIALSACSGGNAPTTLPPTGPLPWSAPVATLGAWGTYANGSASDGFLFVASPGGVTFTLPEDMPPLTSPRGKSDDYLFTPAPDLTSMTSLQAALQVTISPGASLAYAFEPSNTCGGSPTARLVVQQHGGALTDSAGNTLPYTRWYGPAVPLVGGLVVVSADPTDLTDVFGDASTTTIVPTAGPGEAQPTTTPAAGLSAVLSKADVGVVFGGGCFAGHGVATVGGPADITLTSLDAE